LSHALESYVCAKRNLLSQTFAREAWRLLVPNLDVVLRSPTDLEARGAMQLGAHFAGAAIENSMLGACHACANPLTAHYGLTHGITIGILLPHVIRFNAAAVAPLYVDLAHEAGLLNGDRSVAAESLAGRITELMQVANLPTSLSACGVRSGILPVLLVITEPKCRGNANEHQNQLGNPAPEVCETRAFFSCLPHDSREQSNQ